MTGSDAPKRVRIAALLTGLIAPAGLLLLLDGLLELHWWSTPHAARLTTLFENLRTERGLGPPLLLRGRGGALELIVLGGICLVSLVLAPLVRKGRLWARTWALVLGIGTAVLGVVAIGADASDPSDVDGYFRTLTDFALADRIPPMKALLYPSWYMWLEDSAQGLQVLVSIAAVVALGYASIWHADYFVSKKAETATQDEWGATIGRIRAKRAGAENPDWRG